MTIPNGYTPMSPMMLAEVTEQKAQEEHNREREQQARAQAVAIVCKSFGVRGERFLTPAQRVMVDNIMRQNLGHKRSPARGYGFNIPTEGRGPQRW